MPGVKVRNCEDRDLPAVIGLLRELSEVARTGNEFSEKEVREILGELNQAPEIYLNLVAEVEGVVAGFVSVIFYKTLYHKGGTALINELVISRSCRGKGIGRLLVRSVREEAVKRGMDELEVGTETTNEAAQQFYKKCGFNEEYVLLGMEFNI